MTLKIAESDELEEKKDDTNSITLGVEISGNEARCVIVEGEAVIHRNVLTLKDDEVAVNLPYFNAQMVCYLNKFKLSKIFIKGRNRKGRFSGGPAGFKIEAMFQLYSTAIPTIIVKKVSEVALPPGLAQRYKGAYQAAMTGLICDRTIA